MRTSVLGLTQISRPRDARASAESESGLGAGAATRVSSCGPDRGRGGCEARWTGSGVERWEQDDVDTDE
jgi:hypothetical protein